LLCEFFLPSVKLHSRLDLTHVGFSSFIATSLQAFVHGRLELSCSLGVSICIEDTPSLKSRLGKHFTLDLAVNIAHVLLNVKGVRVSICGGTHEKFSSIELKSIESTRVLVE